MEGLNASHCDIYSINVNNFIKNLSSLSSSIFPNLYDYKVFVFCIW